MAAYLICGDHVNLVCLTRSHGKRSESHATNGSYSWSHSTEPFVGAMMGSILCVLGAILMGWVILCGPFMRVWEYKSIFSCWGGVVLVGSCILCKLGSKVVASCLGYGILTLTFLSLITYIRFLI